MKTIYGKLFLIIFCLSISSLTAAAQEENAVSTLTTEFTYQGRLNESGATANGTYDFEFKLVDASGAVLGTLPKFGVPVASGIFTVRLDFGATSFNSAGDKFLEIGVRKLASEPFAVLSPRQPVSATPIAIISSSAVSANIANLSTDSQKLGGVAANQYVLTTDPRLEPGNYVQNSTSLQTGDFTISGKGTAGILEAVNVNAALQYSLNGAKFITAPGINNTFLGIGAGAGWTNGQNNSFFGKNAGQNTTTASSNSFFGSNAGFQNTTGDNNSFFGARSGELNGTGMSNAFFGFASGAFNTTGGNNSYFGSGAGASNSTGRGNSLFGSSAGTNNLADFNSFFGAFSGGANLSGQQNSFFGYQSGQLNSNGSQNSFFGANSGGSNTTGLRNSFFGANSGASNTDGVRNVFFGYDSGSLSTTGDDNTFSGAGSGGSNTVGNFNSFFGSDSGNKNISGDANSFFGGTSGFNNTSGSGNSFFGVSAGYLGQTGQDNVAVGHQAGFSSNGSDNTFVGKLAGVSLTAGSRNTIIGSNSGKTIVTGSDNIALGYNTTIADGVSGSVVIGNNAAVAVSNQIVLGNSFQNTRVAGLLLLNNLANAGQHPVCRTDGFPTVLALCSSSIRYKTDIENFTPGLELIRRLRPVSYTWKQGGNRDLGFIAEEVNAIEPLMTTVNEQGEVEGVKYDRISAALVNAVNQQQTAIESQNAQLKQQQSVIENQQTQLDAQRKQIEALKKLVCAGNPQAGICGEEK